MCTSCCVGPCLCGWLVLERQLKLRGQFLNRVFATVVLQAAARGGADRGNRYACLSAFVRSLPDSAWHGAGPCKGRQGPS